jgi:hypothetical protein
MAFGVLLLGMGISRASSLLVDGIIGVDVRSRSNSPFMTVVHRRYGALSS